MENLARPMPGVEPATEAIGPDASAPAWVPWLVGVLAFGTFALSEHFANLSGLWRDEANTLATVSMPTISDMLGFLAHDESHPPLFYLVLRLWVALFGASDAAAMGLPTLCATLIGPATYALGQRVFGWRAGLVAASAVALAPLVGIYGAQIRPYTLLPLLALGVFFFLHQALELNKPGYWVAHSLMMAAMLLTHNWSWLVAGATWGCAAWTLAIRRRSLFPLAWSMAATLVIFAPWASAFLEQARHAGYGPFPHGPLQALSVLISAVTSVYRGDLQIVAGVILLSTIGAAVCFQRPAGEARQRQALTLVLFLLGPLIVFLAAWALSNWSMMLLARAYLCMTPVLLLVAADGLSKLASWRKIETAWLVGVLVTVFILLDAQMANTPKSNARELAREVGRLAGANDLVVISPNWIAPSFNRYYLPENVQIDFPTFGREARTSFNGVADRLVNPDTLKSATLVLQAAHASGHRVWIITGADQLMPQLPPAAGLPPTVPRDKWDLLGAYRTNQLLAVLYQAYGPPTARYTAAENFDGMETLVALQFDAHPSPTAP